MQNTTTKKLIPVIITMGVILAIAIIGFSVFFASSIDTSTPKGEAAEYVKTLDEKEAIKYKMANAPPIL